MKPAPQDQPTNFNESSGAEQLPSRLRRFTAWHLAALICFLLFVLYPGVILGTHSFFFRDFGLFTYPVAFYEHECFQHGQVPLWNPLNNCGVPFLAQWNTSACYPLSLVYMVFPLPWSLNLFCLGHLVLAGAGMYLLAFRWTRNRLAGGMAGLVFALNGLMLNNLMWTSNLAALAWQPYVILCAEKAWNGGSRRMGLAALAGAMQMLAGAPEIVVFTWSMLGMLWVVRAWRKEFLFWPGVRRMVLLVFLVAALSAVQLLPFIDLLRHSERSSSFLAANTSPMPLWGFGNFVFPLFRTIQTAFGTCLQANQPWTASYYLGGGTLTLAAAAAWRFRRRPEVWLVTGFTLIGLVLALGDDGCLYSWLRRLLPWIGFARYPIKFVAIPVFTIPILAACGFATLQGRLGESAKRRERPIVIAALFLLVSIGFVLAIARWFSNPAYDWHIVMKDGVVRAAFLIATVAAFVASNRVSNLRLRGICKFAVLALTALDLVTAGMSVTPTVVSKAFGPLELNMTALPKLGESRAMVSREVKSTLLMAWTEDPLYYVAGLRGAMMENCNIPQGIPKVDGFCSLHTRYQSDIEDIFYGGNGNAPTNAPPEPLLDFLGVSQLSGADSIFNWRERKSFLPMATAGQKPIFADDGEVLEKLKSPDFNPREEVFLPEWERGLIIASNSPGARVVSEQFGAQEAHLTVESPSPAMVVIARTFYHNWRAYIGDRPTTIFRANHSFQAVEVPAGRHEITLRYEDRIFQWGAIISALALLGCLASLFVRGRN